MKRDKSNDRFEVDANVEERSGDDDLNSERVSASGPGRERVGRALIDVAAGEEDELRGGKAVEAVERDSFEGVHLQRRSRERRPAQPARDEVERAARVESPPWRKRGSDFAWSPEN